MKYFLAKNKDIELVMESRLEMLKMVNELPSNYEFDKEFIKRSIEYYEKADQTTVLAMDNQVVGCATICYIDMMPTYAHPTGKRAHLMNVYTKSQYRRKGIAYKMISMLIQEAKKKGVTEISLDTTELGKPLYEKLGFKQSAESMVFNFYVENE